MFLLPTNPYFLIIAAKHNYVVRRETRDSGRSMGSDWRSPDHPSTI